MTTWLELGASNALAGTALALLAWVVSHFCRRPQVVFAVWLLVLAKLVAPPLVAPPLESLREYFTWLPAVVADERSDLPVNEEFMSDDWDADERFTSELLAAADPAPEMESHDGALEADQLGQLDESIAALPAGEINLPLPDSIRLDGVASAAVEPISIGQFLSAVWLIGSSLWFALAATRILRFRRLLSLARPASRELEAEVDAVARRMRLGQVPEVRVVRGRVSPLVWALGGRATLLLPSELLRRLTSDERATLLAHELARSEEHTSELQSLS
jgi:hypothetical protein